MQADDDYRGVGDSGRERLQEQQRRYVRPMQIVEYHEHRTGRDHHVHDVVEEPERLSAASISRKMGLPRARNTDAHGS